MELPTTPGQIRLGRDLATQRVDGGMVVYRPATRTFLELDDVGAAFWEAIDTTTSTPAAIALIGQHFDVDHERLVEDFNRFVQQLADAGLLVAADATTEVTSDDATRADRSLSRYLDLVERALVGQLEPGAALAPIVEGGYEFTMLEKSRMLSMIGGLRMRNVRDLAERALIDGIPGDFMECGVWRGGAAIMMRAVLAAHETTDRSVWLADSFAGLPTPDLEKYPIDAVWTESHGAIAVSLADVVSNFRRFGLLDDSVRFLPGWFSETLQDAPIDQLAVLRLDGDLYESTIDALTHLYDRVAPGGFVIIDDYCLTTCRRAVDDFRNARSIDADLHHVDWTGVWWRVPQ